jgi:hypothetical protein
LNDAIGDLLDNKVFDSPLGAIMKAIPGKMIGGMVDFLQDKINIFSSSKTGVGTGITLKPGSGTVKQIVFGMAKQMGWHGPQLVALDKLITQESGWNPQADNPTSSAAGLFQKMTSLHGPLENTVAGQAEWGLNYIKQAYGSPIRAWNFHTRNNWYDEGGVARGQGFMPKGTIQPERVLSPRQTDLHDRQTVALERLAAGGGNGRMHLTITNWRDGTGYIESVVDSVNDSDRAFERRRGRMFQ